MAHLSYALSQGTMGSKSHRPNRRKAKGHFLPLHFQKGDLCRVASRGNVFFFFFFWFFTGQA